MVPNVRGQDLYDGPVVLFGLPSDPFEGVDAAQSHLQQFISFVVCRPELIDSPREAFRNLLILRRFQGPLRDLEPSPREVESDADSDPTEELRLGPAVLVYQR